MRQKDIKFGGEYLTTYEGKALVGEVIEIHVAIDNRRRRYDLRIHPLPGGPGIVVTRLAGAIQPKEAAR